MIITQSSDPRKFYAANLTTTNETTVLSASDPIVKTIESLGISCGTSTTLTLRIKHGSDTYVIMNATTLAANTTVPFPVPDFFAILRSGFSLTAQVADANQVCVFGSVIEAMPKTSA